MHPWNELWPQLKNLEVFPLPLATDTRWAAEGWLVEVVMILEAVPGGYSSSRPIFTYSEPYDAELGASAEEADRVTRACTSAFADRLAAVLAGP